MPRASCPDRGDERMRPWKVVLGVGAACAACCALPLLGGATALTVGSTALAALGGALMACADEFAPMALAVLAVSAVLGAAAWWARRGRRTDPPAAVCGGGRHANDR